MIELRKFRGFTPEAHAALAAVMAEDAAAVMRDVSSGACELWCVNGDSWLVTNVDTDARELAVCCYAGRDVLVIADALYRIARKQDLRAVRFFTKRPALARLLKKGFPQLEVFGTVYRCEVAPSVCQ